MQFIMNSLKKHIKVKKKLVYCAMNVL